MNRERFSIDLACMAGPLDERLAAAEAAGFTQAMLWARDLADHPQGYEAAIRLVRDSRLEITGLQLLSNYEGADGPAHAYKLDIAKALLEVCTDVGAPLLVVSASAAMSRGQDVHQAAHDLRKLANLAVPTGVRVGFKSIPWGHSISDPRAAWELVSRARHANLGLVLDAFDFIAGGQPLDSLDEIAPDKILLVQLADFSTPAFQEHRPRDADPMRVFPGSGVLADQVAAFVRHLDRMDYGGDYSLQVSNEDYRQLPARTVAELGSRSMAWVHHQVLRRRLPIRRT